MKKLWLFTLLFSAVPLFSMEAERVETLCKMVIHLDLKTPRLADYQRMDIEQLDHCFNTLNVSGKKIGMHIDGKSTDFKTYLLLRMKCARFALDYIENEMPAGITGKLVIPKCISIQTIDLSNNELTEVPQELFEFKNLKKLFVAHNKITGLPDKLVLMKSLEEADFSHNQIDTVTDKAEWIGKDPLLVRFNISYNKLSKTEKEKLRTEWNKNKDKKKDSLILGENEKNIIISNIEKQCGDPL